MKFLVSTFMALAVMLSCRSRQTTDPFLIEVNLSDSATTFTDGRVADGSYGAELLLDSIASLESAIDDSERFAGVRYPGRVVVQVLSDVPCVRLSNMVHEVGSRQFNECRFVWRETTGEPAVAIPIIMRQDYGVTHCIEIGAAGMTFSNREQAVLNPPPDEPFDARRKPYSLEMTNIPGARTGGWIKQQTQADTSTFRYYNGLSTSFSDFSISIASPFLFSRTFDIGSESDQTHRDSVTIFELTNPAGFLAGAILHNDLNGIDRLISRLPTYPFKELSGMSRNDDGWDSADRREYTPLLLAIEAGAR